MQSKNFDALHILGVIRGMEGRHDEAKALFFKASKLDPNNPQLYFNLAKALSELGQDLEAMPYHERAIRLSRGHPEMQMNYGKSLAKLNRLDDAVLAFSEAIAIKPDYAEAFNNRGNAYLDLKQHEAALASYQQAIAIKPDYAEAFNNRGNAYFDLRQYQLALESYDRAIEINPGYVEALCSRGNAFVFMGNMEAALGSCNKAVAIKPDYAEAFNNRGNIYIALKKYELAINDFKKAYSLNPKGLYLAGTLIHTQMQICDWSDYEDGIRSVIDLISCGEKAAHPFFAMSISDDLDILKKSAQTWVQDRCPHLGFVATVLNSNQKIKIGYFSSDFREHPVSLLTAEMFELHDRDKFEIIAFSFGPNTRDETRKRLELAFDSFLDVRDQSDDEIIRLAQSLKIDIAVDLNGHTQDGRSNIFAKRVAATQLSYIGFLGTMGAPYMDYLIVDPVLVPQHERSGYQEKLVYLPSYQANDRKKIISERKFTREELGLPESGFVFCCFNNNFKITPSHFEIWMKILQRVSDSVLLIYAENEPAKLNLKSQANLHGVDACRLFFAPKLPLDEYLARYRVADLFLDTFPYNAGTTASDALWAGLPVLTMQGRSFASRMASSLLTAIDLPELITSSKDEYINKAVQVATQEGLINELRVKLDKNKHSKLLFDSPKFTKHLENAYLEIYQQKLKGLPVEDVYIQAVH